MKDAATAFAFILLGAELIVLVFFFWLMIVV